MTRSRHGRFGGLVGQDHGSLQAGSWLTKVLKWLALRLTTRRLRDRQHLSDLGEGPWTDGNQLVYWLSSDGSSSGASTGRGLCHTHVELSGSSVISSNSQSGMKQNSYAAEWSRQLKSPTNLRAPGGAASRLYHPGAEFKLNFRATNRHSQNFV